MIAEAARRLLERGSLALAVFFLLRSAYWLSVA